MLSFFATARQNPARFELVVLRPWFISKPAADGTLSLGQRVFGALVPSRATPVALLAAALVDAALHGSPENVWMDNDALKAKGAKALKAQPS